MRIERGVGGFGIGLMLALSGCGSVLQTNTDGGGDGGQSACRKLDEAACVARTGCATTVCSSCAGPIFAGCYNPTFEQPPVCPQLGIPCPALCSGLDEAACKSRTDCRADTCPNCNGASSFVRCAAIDDSPPACIAIACPQPRCTDLTAKDACETRTDCHSVYVDGRTCGCAALGCCTRWSRCADGATALCKAPAISCDAATPYCEGPYVVSYTNSCYEGCALATDCALN